MSFRKYPNCSVSNLFYEHFSSRYHSGEEPDFTIEVIDSQVYSSVYIIVVLLNRHLNHSELTVTLNSILSMVDSMLYSSLGAIPSVNPFGCQGFEITIDPTKDNEITIDIGYAGFDRKLLKEKFFLTSLDSLNSLRNH